MTETTASLQHFRDLPLKPELLAAVVEAGYQQMTPTQALSLPAILQGQNLVVQAETGSGKTAAFALGMLNKLQRDHLQPQALVLCPTRELAEQVAETIRGLAKTLSNVKVLTLCGGVPVRNQLASLEHGAHILVGTPGRILDHLNQQRLSLADIHTLVLDEADRMLEMGFQDDLTAIVKGVPQNRQSLLFSATYPESIVTLAHRVASKAQHIRVQPQQQQAQIQQVFYRLDNSSAAAAVETILRKEQPQQCIVFCNTKVEVKRIAQHLQDLSFSTLALHGDLEQRERDQAMVQFSHGSGRVLVATDVAARGLDITALDLVINTQLAHDTDTHTHRIGRTGRAGETGLAISFIGPGDDYKMRLLEDELAAPIQLQSLPPAPAASKPLTSQWVTLQLTGGKKDKLRPGDIVGALTRDNQIRQEQLGKIKVQSQWSFVTVNKAVAKHALALLNQDRIKGKRFRARAV